MTSLSPSDYMPLILAAFAVALGLWFGRRGDGDKPYGLVSLILYAVALGCLVIEGMAWLTRGA